jgi:LacI family transcriptional regulator
LSPGKQNVGQFCVATNDREVCAEMTRYLASLGHRKIAFIRGHPDHKAVGNRFLGYQDGLKQCGLPVSDEFVVEGDNSILSGEACATRLLNQPQPPTAIFAANDDMAAGVIRVAERLEIKVPEQLSVAGCDDIALAQQIYPALTTINQPLAAMADEAVRLLINPDRKTTTPRTYVVPGALRVRDSTGPAPA